VTYDLAPWWKLRSNFHEWVCAEKARPDALPPDYYAIKNPNLLPVPEPRQRGINPPAIPRSYIGRAPYQAWTISYPMVYDAKKGIVTPGAPKRSEPIDYWEEPG